MQIYSIVQTEPETTYEVCKVKAKDFDFVKRAIENTGIKLSVNFCQTLLDRYLRVKANDRLMPNDEAIKATIDLAKYLEEHGDSRMSIEDVIIQALFNIMKIHCCVMYSKDLLNHPENARFKKLKIAANQLNHRLGYKDQKIVWTFKFHVIK